jgi:transcriptional regulator with XRE-family HTH domain
MLSLSSPAPDLARVLASGRERRGLSLRQLAIRAETSASHLSRLESGERAGVSRELLGRLAEVLEIEPAELFAAAHLLPPDVERYRWPAPTRAVLRRLHIAHLVERRFPAGPRQLHDPIELLSKRGFTFDFVGGDGDGVMIEGTRVRATTARAFAERASTELRPIARFLAAHALGHVVLDEEPACAFRTLAPPELDATAFASHLLAPPPALRFVVLGLAGDADVWAGATGALIENAAARLVAPAWLVARRAGEDGLLAEVAKVGEL